MKIKLARVGISILVLLFFFQATVAQRVSHIKINESNANLYRDSVNLLLFGTTAFPYDILPNTVTTNINTIDYYPGSNPYTSLIYPAGNLDSIDRFSIFPSNNLVDFPQPVQAYVFHPHQNNGQLFIYHSGHCAGSTTVEDILGNNEGTEPGLIIPGLLKEGYTVLAVPMLYYGFTTPQGLECGYDGHNNLFLEAHYANPLGLFFKPLIASLNQLGRSNYSGINMCGLSGGGWTTSIYPAVDSSITCSFPVAGSFPLPVASVYYPGGDYEQVYPPLFRNLLDYHELYTLSCLAPARKMVQINNRYDACCFNGTEAHLFYVDSVTKALEGTNGEFRFYLDETQTTHSITARSLEVMITFMKNERATLNELPADTVIAGALYSYNIKINFEVNTVPDNSILKYSLLKAPDWLGLNTGTGILSGIVPEGNIVTRPDTVSFKVEDSTGRFVLYNYILVKKRTAPYFFTKFNDSLTVYCLPHYSGSLQQVDPLVGSSFYFNNPLLSVTNVSILNNSLIKLKLNAPLSAADSIGYNGYAQPNAIRYVNGSKMDDFGLTDIKLNGVAQKYAVAGMIRFNTDTGKFEYFNGVSWINLNQ